MSRVRLVLVSTIFLLSLLACGAGDATVAPAAVPVVAVGPPVAAVAVDPAMPSEGGAVVESGDLGPIPVTSADPQRGHADALVTLVEFADYQCPFCGRVEPTLEKLTKSYDPSQLRIVWKHDPLPFHQKARPASIVATLVHQRRGNEGFWRVHEAFFGDQAHLDDLINDAASLAGGTPEDLRASPDWARAEAKVDADAGLAKTLGVSGIPAFFVNGVSLVGAQPYEKFAEVIDEQLGKAKDALAHGTSRSRLYVELAKAQWKPAPPPAPNPPPDDRARRIPVGKSPVRGKAAALVTLVEFADFQCPFCGRVEPTLKQLAADYGDKLRIVFKNNPLPFHPRASQAATLALEARAQKGDRGFWAAHDLLFDKECIGSPGAQSRQACMDAGGTWLDHQTNLEDADLEKYAKALGLNVAAVDAAIASKKYAAALLEDETLAEESGAEGTPSFFVNGRRLVGVQPIEAFRKVIDEEIARANDLVAQGVPSQRVYERLQASALAPAFEFEKRTVPAPTGSTPSRGPAGAKVVVQMFADFQCPFCARAVPTIEELEKAYPGKIRVVWRNLPLPFHANAALAAEAALEARAQRGNAGFWDMHALLYTNQTALDRAALDGYAARIGLDMQRFALALDTRAHKPEVEADEAIARAAGISGTPTFVIGSPGQGRGLINGYFVSGAQPLPKFLRVVAHALAEAK